MSELPKDPAADDALFALASLALEDGDVATMKGHLLALIRDWPRSPFVPPRLLALG